MLQKQRKVGEPSTPDVYTGAGGGSKAAIAAALGRNAMSKLDEVAARARQQQEEEQRLARAQAVRRCSC